MQLLLGLCYLVQNRTHYEAGPCIALMVGTVDQQIVYEFLLRYVVCQDTDAKAAKKYIDQVAVNLWLLSMLKGRA